MTGIGLQNITSGGSHNFEHHFMCVEYPGVVKDVNNMIDTLGGLENISQVYAETNRRLELRFRPSDPYCKPTCGESQSKMSLLMKVVRRKKKFSSGNNSSAAEKETYRYSVLGIVDICYKFSNLCDFQFLPLETGVDGEKISLYKQLVPHEVVTSEWLQSPASLFLPPAAFSRMDVPQDYQFRREALSEKGPATPHNIIGRIRQRRSIHAIFVTFDVENVPTRPRENALNQLKLKFIDDNQYKQIKDLFDERPVWSKNALNFLVGLHKEKLKFLLPCVAYYFTTGPWRNQWVRFGYDPRKKAEASIYQTLDYRVKIYGGARNKVKAKRSYTSYLLPYKAMNWSKPKTSVISKEHFSGDGTHEEATTSNQKEKIEIGEEAYIFQPGTIPPYRQMLYQYCDLKVPEIQALLHNLTFDDNTVCIEKTGWLPSRIEEQCREIISKLISDKISKDSQCRSAHQERLPSASEDSDTELQSDEDETFHDEEEGCTEQKDEMEEDAG